MVLDRPPDRAPPRLEGVDRRPTPPGGHRRRVGVAPAGAPPGDRCPHHARQPGRGQGAEDAGPFAGADRAVAPDPPAHPDRDEHHHRQRERDRPGDPEQQRAGGGRPPPLAHEEQEERDEQQHAEGLGVGHLEHRRGRERRPHGHGCERRSGGGVRRGLVQQLRHQQRRPEAGDQGQHRGDRREVEPGEGAREAGGVREERVERPRVLLDPTVRTDRQGVGVAAVGDPLVPDGVPGHGQVDVALAGPGDPRGPDLLVGGLGEQQPGDEAQPEVDGGGAGPERPGGPGGECGPGHPGRPGPAPARRPGGGGGLVRRGRVRQPVAGRLPHADQCVLPAVRGRGGER